MSEINLWRIGDRQPERKRTGIHAAIALGDLAQVQEWIAKGVDIEQTDSYGDRPLSLAAALGNAEIVALLLKNGAHPDLYSLSLPPLAEAIYRGHLNVVQTLIAATADVKATLEEGDSLLMLAVLKGNAEIVSVLIEAGANINATNQHGDTALMTAARCGHLKITQILIGAGADVDVMNRYCATALSCAAENGYLPLCEYLVALTDPELRLFSLNQALFTTSREGKATIVDWLCRAGADVDIMNEEGQTALMVAAVARQPAVILMLVQARSNVNARDKNGQTALVLAAKFRNSREARLKGIVELQIEIIRLLTQAGADLNVGNSNGQTALMLAVEFGPPEVVDLLLQTGADVNARDSQGNSALSYAQRRSGILHWQKKHRSEIIRLLCEAGAEE